MRTLIAVFALSLAGSASAQEARQDATETPRVAVGVIAAPALEGGGPWFMPAVRFSVPLGSKHGFDLDAGRILGGTDPYSEVEHFVAGQVRFVHKPAPPARTTQYWLIGLRYLDLWKLDGHGDRRRHAPDTALSLGYGWAQSPRSGVRIVSEAGFSGGSGYLLYLNVGLQWEPWASRLSKRAAREGRP